MRRWLAAPIVLGVALAAVPAGSALADTTPGQTTLGQTGTAVVGWWRQWDDVNPLAVVPADGGTITSFQTQSADSSVCQYFEDTYGEGPGVFDFQVLRPQPNGGYLVVGDTGNQTDPCDGQLHSYPVNIPVQAGDVLGVYTVSLWAGGQNGGTISYGTYLDTAPEPQVGQTIPATGPLNPPSTLDESATLVTTAQNLVNLGNAAGQAGGPGASLTGKLQQAQSDIQAGNVTAACSVLTAFINQVNAQAGKSITAGTAGQLITEARQIQSSLNC